MLNSTHSITRRPHYLLDDANWGKVISLLEADIPGNTREQFRKRVDFAKTHPKLNRTHMENLLVDKPEVVWKEVIPGLDGDSLLDQESVLYAAQGLRKNYEESFGDNKEADHYHPEYLVKINQTFCSKEIKRLQSLCKPVKNFSN